MPAPSLRLPLVAVVGTSGRGQCTGALAAFLGHKVVEGVSVPKGHGGHRGAVEFEWALSVANGSRGPGYARHLLLYQKLRIVQQKGTVGLAVV